MGPDRAKHLRNAAIIVVLALIVWRVPGGGLAGQTVSNLLSVVFVGGLLFFGYRIYIERRDSLHGLGDRRRGLLYASLALAVFALVATHRLWGISGGLGAFLWFALIIAAVWGVYSVWRAWRAY